MNFLGAQVVEEALLDSGVSKEEVDWLVLHQANQRILDSAAQRLGISGEKVPSSAGFSPAFSEQGLG